MGGKVAAILLAAGSSRRMGSCKQLLPLAGKTVLATCLETLLEGGVEEIVVVVAPSGKEVAQAAEAYPVRVVRNAEPDGDMAASILTGRGALSASCTGVLVALCDYPLVRADTISRLQEEHRKAPDRVILPSHGGRRGHPPLLPRGLLDRLQPSQTLRDLLRAGPDPIRQLDLPDPGILIDMDTPEDYRRVLALQSGSL